MERVRERREKSTQWMLPCQIEFPHFCVGTARFFYLRSFWVFSLIINGKVRSFASHGFSLLPKTCALLPSMRSEVK